MKLVLVAGLVFLSLSSLAQTGSATVRNAELRFASYSVQHGTKEAFLKFADSSAVVFEQGKAVNAIATWNKRESRPGVLNWHPVFSGLAASGDLGFTSGPWAFQPKTTEDSVVAKGIYNTVWHKSNNGEWKFLVDIGVNSSIPASMKSIVDFSTKKISFAKGTKEDLLQAEADFIAASTVNKDRLKAYEHAVSTKGFVLNRNDQEPVRNKKDLATVVNKMSFGIVYDSTVADVATSGDLGYVYGNTVINGKGGNYLRIWRREGQQWKLLLEVLPY